MNWSSLMRPNHRAMKESSAAADHKSHDLPSLPPRVPAVSIHETQGAIVVVADMPGVTQDKVDITIEQDVVTMRGSVAADVHDGFQQVYREYDTTGFERSFTIPSEVDRDHIDATVKNGVLTLTLPKHKSLQPRRITVTSG
jgi:HSP20 family protein